MTCECQLCKDIKHLRECGVSEEFMDRWLNEGMDSSVNASILDGSWPSAVEQLQCALDNAIKSRGE
ncbi:hypothetical protein D3C75_1219980 [compost metagenome]